jgi:hypothetical protein
MSSSGLFARARGRRAAWRSSVPVVALLALVGQTSALLHRALVQHATCAEHGESVHLAAVANPSVSLPGMGAEHPDLSAAVDETVPDHHEHCAAADTRSPATRLVPDRCTQLLPAGTAPVAVCDQAVGTAVASYLIAPKTSPPRSAS